MIEEENFLWAIWSPRKSQIYWTSEQKRNRTLVVVAVYFFGWPLALWFVCLSGPWISRTQPWWDHFLLVLTPMCQWVHLRCQQILGYHRWWKQALQKGPFRYPPPPSTPHFEQAQLAADLNVSRLYWLFRHLTFTTTWNIQNNAIRIFYDSGGTERICFRVFRR